MAVNFGYDLMKDAHHIAAGDSCTWFGRRVPEGIEYIEMWLDPFYGDRWVGWVVRRDKSKHKMSFENSDDGRNAVIIAMKLTC